ncbi:MAG TPA: radical SAM protein [Acetobacteraceae bacterium]|nr:radical SAM protein [Acetobacteraceae bacterium]
MFRADDAPRAELRRLDRLLPAVCDFSVTNLCNAACEFCGFARDKNLAGAQRHADAEAFALALPILRRRGIRYITLQGGEPLVHPEIVRLVADTAAAGIQCALITNGWFLPRSIAALAAAGLGRLIISIDSADAGCHEENRGLDGLMRRIAEGVRRARGFGLPVQASITVSRLVRYDDLPDMLARLGFDVADFSYPRREPFGSTSLVHGGESKLVDLDSEELLEALAGIARVKRRFPVLNPAASLAEIARYVRGEQQAVPCVGGYKYFYLDWNLDIWRCEAWNEPMGSVFNLDRIPDQRQPCHACMMACYRNASILMHAGIAATDALQALRRADVGTAVATLFRRSVALSAWALAAELPHVRRLSRRLPRAVCSPEDAVGTPATVEADTQFGGD